MQNCCLKPPLPRRIKMGYTASMKIRDGWLIRKRVQYPKARLSAAVLAAVILALSGGCNRSRPIPPEAPALPGFPWQALAFLKTGENPLWFELGEDGPRLIPSPSDASLVPYVPWPLSRHIAGVLAWEDRLVLAVNRDGFLVVDPASEGEGVLYRSADPEWDPYSIASFFIYETNPAVLLYRDNFFSEPEAPPLTRPVMILGKDSPFPVAAGVLAPDILPAGEGWEINALNRGPDGFWYYRLKGTGKKEPETVYLRAGDLSLPGERISAAGFRNSFLPENAEKAPPFADAFLDLPPLPEGFAYTGAGLAGDILIASWEEQEDSAVGAAGFMAVQVSNHTPEFER
jgi:hypothetical protein